MFRLPFLGFSVGTFAFMWIVLFGSSASGLGYISYITIDALNPHVSFILISVAFVLLIHLCSLLISRLFPSSSTYELLSIVCQGHLDGSLRFSPDNNRIIVVEDKLYLSKVGPGVLINNELYHWNGDIWYEAKKLLEVCEEKRWADCKRKREVARRAKKEQYGLASDTDVQIDTDALLTELILKDGSN